METLKTKFLQKMFPWKQFYYITDVSKSFVNVSTPLKYIRNVSKFLVNVSK